MKSFESEDVKSLYFKVVTQKVIVVGSKFGFISKNFYVGFLITNQCLKLNFLKHSHVKIIWNFNNYTVGFFYFKLALKFVPNKIKRPYNIIFLMI